MGRRPGNLDRGDELSRIRPLTATDLPQLSEVLVRSWGSTQMDTRGRLVDVLDLPGFVAEDDDGNWTGYLCYEDRAGNVEVVALEALVRGQGVGAALIARTLQAIQDSATRLWLLTSNDNMDALRFYQRRGFVLVAVHVGAITHARQTMKPEIPLTGHHDIPLRDEIELELPHGIWDDFIERYSWPS